MGTPELVSSAGSPPEQIVCTPEILLVPVSPFTRTVSDAVSLQPLAFITSTEITEPSVKLKVADAVLKILPETPVVRSELFT